MRIYKTQIGKNEVTIEYNIVNNNEAWMEYVHYEPEYIKTFIILLEHSIKDLIKLKIDTLVQTVNLKEWKEFLELDNRWKLRAEQKEIELVVIECKIGDACNAILSGFNFK
jgi:hypothetical protein